MTGYDTCKLFQALNNHFFQGGYDYIKYGGSVTIKAETYDKKNPTEKHRYESLGRKFGTKEELENFIVANLLNAKKRAWIGELAGGNANELYLKWQGRVQALQYNLTNELRLLLEDHQFNALFECEPLQHPEILKAYMRGELSLESFVILDLCLDFIPKIDKKLGDDRNWMIVRRKAIKYKPFLERLNSDVESLRGAIRQTLKDMEVTS